MSINKTATVTISREFFDDLLRYFSYFPDSFYHRIADYYNLRCSWTEETFDSVLEYANLNFVGYYKDELQKPSKDEMHELQKKIQNHLFEKLLAVGNREKYRQGQFQKGNWAKK